MSEYKRPAVPSFKKGDFVIPKKSFGPSASGSRKMTIEEKEAWYANPHNQGIGDDGESKVCSGTWYQRIPAGTQMIVTRARVSAQVGFSNVGGLCEVKILATREVLLVARSELQLGQ